MSASLFRKGYGAGHALDVDVDRWTALCGQTVDGSYTYEDTYAPSSNPAGSKLCLKCNDIVGAASNGCTVEEWREYMAS